MCYWFCKPFLYHIHMFLLLQSFMDDSIWPFFKNCFSLLTKGFPIFTWKYYIMHISTYCFFFYCLIHFQEKQNGAVCGNSNVYSKNIIFFTLQKLVIHCLTFIILETYVLMCLQTKETQKTFFLIGWNY